MKRLMDKIPFPIPNNLDDKIKNIVQKATMIDIENRASSTEIKELFEEQIKANNIGDGII